MSPADAPRSLSGVEQFLFPGFDADALDRWVSRVCDSALGRLLSRREDYRFGN
ncbi:hypothetical protein ACFFKU_02765 [Kineococcus gynurae]|uniref:Uncharacterized protein n=1 Tax=Kineococcus gynurae TaxID=452979 RepID=A0ABV5LSB0_9ACTN